MRLTIAIFVLLSVFLLFARSQEPDDYDEASSSSEEEEYLNYEDNTRTQIDNFMAKNSWARRENSILENDQNDEKPGQEMHYTYASICLVDGNMTVLHGFDCRYPIAIGRFRNAVNQSGWSFLEIETKANHPEELQAYAAGFLEGHLSKVVLNYHLTNTIYEYCKGFKGYCDRLTKFVKENMDWIKEELATKQSSDNYWKMVNLTIHQLTGLDHGFNNLSLQPGASFEVTPFLMLQLNGGDFYDLEKKFNKTKDPSTVDGKCSGFVKVAPDNRDLFFAQVTMSGFQNMMRVLKLYKFGYDQKLFPGHTTTFAGYPGILYSTDDFTLLSSGLAALETTVSVFNNSLFNLVQAKDQLPCWIRTIVANTMAHNGSEWCEIFEQYNSGTYNNQWVLVDYKQFTPGQPLPPNGVLYVLEQMPGLVVYRDITWYLNKHSYYASYNIPFFKKITETSGFDKQCYCPLDRVKADKMGTWFRWGQSPRALIFERDHNNVTDLPSLTRLMRYNDYMNDKFSRCNCTPPYTAEAGISARGDLNPANGTFPFPGMGHVNHGGLDMKGTNSSLFKQLRFFAWGGPTYQEQPPFKWSTFDMRDKIKHVGHPDEWKFQPITTTWETDVGVD